MIAPVVFDVIPLLENVVNALKSYARGHSIELSFSSAAREAPVYEDAQKLVCHFSSLLCQVINYLPFHARIMVSVKQNDTQLIVDVHTAGANLTCVHEIIKDNALGVESSFNEGENSFRFTLNRSEHKTEERFPVTTTHKILLPDFYAEVRKRLRSHFTKAENLVALLYNEHPQEAQFLQKINQLIEKNIDTPSFDTAALCTAMNMSRTQLFRRLKPLIRQAPACYIKTIRLQKAKELLETTSLTVGEVTYKTGFQSQSHFTKVFIQHYGVAPGLFRRSAHETK